MNNTVLEIQDLNIQFTQYERGLRRRELHPVRGLSCIVREGEMAAVVGASGSGKSLLAHAVMGTLPYNCKISGRILYRGEILGPERLARLRGKEIALIPQGVSCLDPLMRVGSQIRKGRKDPASWEKCRILLERYGLGAETERLYPFELSGGMARRVLIAAALMGEPRLILADEPTPGLEPSTARRVMGHFREMASDGAAVLVITHDLNLALQTADRLLVFYDGGIIEDLRPEEFLSENGRKQAYTEALYQAMPENGFHVWEEGHL